MLVEVIAIGDELLIGQTINTNAAWIGKELSLMGISVKRCTVISDDKDSIKNTIDEALKRAQLVLVTGGLGPTKDDITKHTLCEYFETELEINTEVLKRVEQFFKDRGREMLEVNKQQALLPKSATVMHNYHGTASGMWFEKEGSVLISMPGVPYEMKGIMKDEVFPKLKEKFQIASIYHKTILLQGIGESFLADKIQDWENRVRSYGLGLAYLPSTGIVKLRLTSSKGKVDAPAIDQFFDEIKEGFPVNYFGEGADNLSEVVGRILKANKKTIGTVESCTGGSLANRLVGVSGASNYFQGSFLTYSNELKNKIVEVTNESLKEYGAVSEQVVLQMAKNGREKLGVDYCLATSGIAGPDGGTEHKPVGTIWIGVAGEGFEKAYKFQFGNHRERNIEMTVLTALNLLRCSMLGINNTNIQKK
jgi:nicotinamide-nucleotide amidase